MRASFALIGLILIIGCSSEQKLPEFHLTFSEPLDWEKKKPCELTIEHLDEKILFGGKAEYRGGYSSKFAKHSFSIELENDHKILGLPANDDWVLNANYIDKTLMRHKLSYDLFSEMSESNIAPRSAYCQLKVNDNYEGLYVLMEKVNAAYLGLNKKDSMAMLFKDPPVFRVEDKIEVLDSSNFFEQKFPKVKKRDQSSFLLEFRKFILISDNETFEREITNWIDLDSFIDWHLLILFTNNGDGILKNFFLYKLDSNTPLRICPWDYDHSFGRDGDNELNMAERNADPLRNILLKRLVETSAHSYNESLRSRWNELRTTVFSEDHFFETIDRLDVEIKHEIGKNFGRWPYDSDDYFDDNTYEKEVEVLKKYFKKRIPELDKMFE